ncbi:ABC transporter permease [Falsibacillus albus]|uniref:ABC transporter permease n=1 Tax=Falsibacillus albus TaxID=2478915 RepID=A0A3L7JRB6_9BACI|nr:ABC-2 family transporter protein [Falsibacillus albus]RLQ93377.1 ABC transporter permease [Falsibacillus albus]
MWQKIKRYSFLYTKYFTSHLKVMLEYKGDFFIGMLSVLVQQLTAIFFLKIVFDHIEALKGWTFYQILFIYAVAFLGRAVHHIFFDNLWTVGWQYIRSGTFDRLLLRPVNPLFQIISERVQQDGFGQLLIGIFILHTAASHLHIQWGVSSVFMLLLFILSSGIIFVAINLFFITFSFWMIDSLPLVVSMFQFSDFARYPVNIYPKAITLIITWIIPYGFTAFYPAAYFFENQYYSVLALLTPVVSLITMVLSYLFWNRGVKSFSSTGS